MRIGTKSVLVGAHQFLLHPILIAIGWWLAYGFKRVPIQGVVVHRDGNAQVTITYHDYASLLRPALWVAFFIHDFGYLGKPNMDGAEGELHPLFGAAWMQLLFGPAWGDFVRYHSRYLAKAHDRPVSPLCYADKWVIVLEPTWLYLPRVWLSGELDEYVANAAKRASDRTNTHYTDRERADWLSGSGWRWHRSLRTYMRRWVLEHQDGKEDTWTRARQHGAAA